jgi:multidrug resistance protein, MATE family
MLIENKENLQEEGIYNRDARKTMLTTSTHNHDKRKNMMKKITSLALPSVFSSLIVYSLETINLIFAGKIELSKQHSKQDVLNAIGIGNIFMNFGGFLFGLGIITSLETLCSQSFGKNDKKEMAKWVKLCNYFMSFYFVILSILCYYAKNIILILGQPQNIAIIATYYLWSLIPSFIIQFYLTIFTKLLNAQQIYKPVMYINIVALCFHPLWCYIFYLKLELSIIGLGIAYTLTSLVMLICTYFYVLRNDLLENVTFKEITWKENKFFLKMAVECGVLSSIDTLGFEIISFLSSYLPQNQLDANICVINIYNNIYSISIGFATTMTTLVGNYMGENKPKLALKFTHMGILIDFSLTVCISLCCIFFHRYIALIYIDDKSILRISSKLIRLVGIYIIFDALQLQLCGVIRGIGLQFKGMCVGIILFIFIQTGICIIFVNVLELGVYGLWFAQIICVIVASIIYYLIIKFSDCNKLALEITEPIVDNKERLTLTKDKNFVEKVSDSDDIYVLTSEEKIDKERKYEFNIKKITLEVNKTSTLHENNVLIAEN